MIYCYSYISNRALLNPDKRSFLWYMGDQYRFPKLDNVQNMKDCDELNPRSISQVSPMKEGLGI